MPRAGHVSPSIPGCGFERVRGREKGTFYFVEPRNAECPPFLARACVCDTATFTVLYPGIGAYAGLAPQFFGTIGDDLPVGPSYSLGAGGAAAIAPYEGEISVDIDPQSKAISAAVNFGPDSLAGGAYVAVRINGACTGCSAYAWEIVERQTAMWGCVFDVLSKLTAALQGFAGPRDLPDTQSLPTIG
jgi:hypothetical protein